MSLTFEYIVESVIITGIINPLILLVSAVALLVFLYGVVKYVISGGNEDKRKEGRDFILYGIIGLFVMISVWGLVNVLTNTFFPGGVNSQQTIPSSNNQIDSNSSVPPYGVF